MTSGLIEHLHTWSRLWGHPDRPARRDRRVSRPQAARRVEHALARVPFYREKLEAAGVDQAT